MTQSDKDEAIKRGINGLDSELNSLCRIIAHGMDSAPTRDEGMEFGKAMQPRKLRLEEMITWLRSLK